MLQGHELSKEIIDIEFNNQLAIMAKQFGYSSALQSASAQQQLMLARQKLNYKLNKQKENIKESYKKSLIVLNWSHQSTKHV